MAHALGPTASISPQLPHPVATPVVSHRRRALGYSRSPLWARQAVIPGVFVHAVVFVVAAAGWAPRFAARRAAYRNHRGRNKRASVRATSNKSGAAAGAIAERDVFLDAILSHFGHPLGSLLKDLSEPVIDFVIEVRSKLGNPMDKDVYAMLAVARLREMQLQAEIFNEERKIKLLQVVLGGVRRSIEDIDDEVLELELERDEALERAKKAEAVLKEHNQAMLQLNRATRELDAELSMAHLRVGGIASVPHRAAEEQPAQGTLLSPGTMDEAALRRECSYWLRSNCVQDLPPVPNDETSLAKLRAWVRTARIKGRRAQQLVSGVPSFGSPRQTSRVQLSAARSSQGLAPEGSGDGEPDRRPSFVGVSLHQPSMGRAQSTVPRMEQSSKMTDGRFSTNGDAGLVVLTASWAHEIRLQKQLSHCKRSVMALKATLNATTKYTRDTEEEALAVEMARDEAVTHAKKVETKVFHERLHRSSELTEAKEKLERALTAARSQLGLDSKSHAVEPSVQDQCLPSPGSMDEQQLRAEGARMGYGPPPAGEEASLAKLRAWVRSARRRARKA